MTNEYYFLCLENHVTGLFLSKPDKAYPYHNLAHTQKVVEHCREMSTFYSLPVNDNILLYTAAWFHDTGHLFTSIWEHETESVRLMHDFIKDFSISAETGDKIEQCILSTRVNQEPVSLLEMILCDADLYHLGTEEFFETDEQVRKEMELRTDSNTTNWKHQSLAFLERHHFYTNYCRELLNEGKQSNIQKLKRLLQVD